MTLANLSILTTGEARAIRFSALDAICEAISCQPGDIPGSSLNTQSASDRQWRLRSASAATSWRHRKRDRRA